VIITGASVPLTLIDQLYIPCCTRWRRSGLPCRAWLATTSLIRLTLAAQRSVLGGSAHLDRESPRSRPLVHEFERAGADRADRRSSNLPTRHTSTDVGPIVTTRWHKLAPGHPLHVEIVTITRRPCFGDRRERVGAVGERDYLAAALSEPERRSGGRHVALSSSTTNTVVIRHLARSQTAVGTGSASEVITVNVEPFVKKLRRNVDPSPMLRDESPAHLSPSRCRRRPSWW